ncbi:hypothetical protein JCM8202v2_006027 [Rhodotorula sphaerocarpa]
MMLPQIGLPGQLRLKHAHVLVVGAGGLGCPVLLYLAAAGEITILDHDTVELSNLHRQVLHTEARVGMSKAHSAKQALDALNSDVRVHAVQLAFTPELFHQPRSADPPTPRALLDGAFTLVLDCSDNPATRHFLNAYAAAHRLPLVSGGAVRAEGTVGVFNLPLSSKRDGPDQEQETDPAFGPCYACIFPPSGPPPSPPAAPPLRDDGTAPAGQAWTEAEWREHQRREDAYYERLSLSGTGACADEGVIGILCGVVGIGMASEAMRVLLGTATPTLHLCSPLSPSPYRTIKMRARKPTCPACGSPDLDAGSEKRDESPSRNTAQSRWQAFLASRTASWPGWQDPLCQVPGVGQSVAGSSAGEGRSRARRDPRVRVDDLRERLLGDGTPSGNDSRGGGDGRRASTVRVIDTRPPAEYGIANLEGSINIPFARLLKDPSLALTAAASASPISRPAPPSGASTVQNGDNDTTALPVPDRITFVCRRGNDSLLASRALRRYLEDEGHRLSEGGNDNGVEHDGAGAIQVQVEVDDLVGGLAAWAREGEEGFPVY